MDQSPLLAVVVVAKAVRDISVRYNDRRVAHTYIQGGRRKRGEEGRYEMRVAQRERKVPLLR